MALFTIGFIAVIALCVIALCAFNGAVYDDDEHD